MIDYTILNGKRVAFATLGCKLNFAETSTLGETLFAHGAVRAQKGEQADICIVNTCTVTAMADSKCRQAIHKIIKENPTAFVAVTGCYAQLSEETISCIDGVDLVVGAQRREQLIDQICYHLSPAIAEENNSSEDSPTKKTTPELFQNEKISSISNNKTPSPAGESRGGVTGGASFFPSCSHGDRTRYFLKVQDGCNYFCTYCTIPFARGRSRNGSIDMLVGQARQVAEQGGKEIVITGVNIGDFGRSTQETFLDLIRSLDKVEGIERYRISSIEPNLLSDEIIEFCASSRAFMPHFHIPLQSGSDTVLRLMHRHYDTALFRQRIVHIMRVMPDAFIGVDVMTGTRGEMAECFEEAYQFIESLGIAQLHVFTYSERPGTKALEIPHVVSPKEKRERTNRLLELSDRKTADFYRRHIGREADVLLEHTSHRLKPMNGFTDNYIRVELPNHPELDNHIVRVRLGDFNDKRDALLGELI